MVSHSTCLFHHTPEKGLPSRNFYRKTRSKAIQNGPHRPRMSDLNSLFFNRIQCPGSRAQYEISLKRQKDTVRRGRANTVLVAHTIFITRRKPPILGEVAGIS